MITNNKVFYVGLEHFRKVCYVGLYPEEKKIPNTLEFNIKVGIGVADISEIPDWDYTLLAGVVQDTLDAVPHHELLEDILKKVVTALKEAIDYKKLQLSIKKLNPPTDNSIQASYVEWIEK